MDANDTQQVRQHTTYRPRKRSKGWGCGCGTLFSIGGLAALWISWQTTHHFWWTVFHGMCGWWYVLYRVFFHWPELLALFK